MSKFTGKCDFCDHLWMSNSTVEEILDELKKTDIYVRTNDNREHRIEVNTLLDAARYYPYIISLMYHSKERAVIVLSQTSFIDLEEAHFLNTSIDDIMKYWRKCKKNKIKFIHDECYKAVSFFDDDRNYLNELIERVAEKGKTADFSGIHIPRYERLRKEWFDELVSLGENQLKAFVWCFNEPFPSKDTTKKRLGKEIEIYAQN